MHYFVNSKNYIDVSQTELNCNHFLYLQHPTHIITFTQILVSRYIYRHQ